MGLRRVGDLEIDQDLDFQRREWHFERIGWSVMGLLVLLAMLGLFGTGPLSSATAGSAESGLTVEYQRFIRRQGEVELIVTIDARHASNGEVRLWIAADYLEQLEISVVSPEPSSVEASGGRQTWVFTLEEGATSIEVSFSGAPQTIGRFAGELGTGSGTTVSFSQFSYP